MTYPRAISGAHEHASSPPELGPDHPLLFHAMHVDTARDCLAAGCIPSTRASLADPKHRIVGVAHYVRARLNAPIGRPHLGMVADATPLTFTPHTRSVYASCGPVVQPGAARIPRTEIAIALVPHASIVDAGLQVLYSDRSPAHGGAALSEAFDPNILPWQRFRTMTFASRDADPMELARYGAEVLVWAQLPLALASCIAVYDEATAAALRAEAGSRVPILAQASWFFSDKRRLG